MASSEGSSGGKSKKRSSLFSPRKSKKEKKAKNEGGAAGSRHSGDGETPPKHKSLWKAVFSGYKKDKKKKQQSEDKSCPSTPSSGSTTQDSGKKGKSSPDGKTSGTVGGPGRRGQSFIASFLSLPPWSRRPLRLLYGSCSALIKSVWGFLAGGGDLNHSPLKRRLTPCRLLQS